MVMVNVVNTNEEIIDWLVSRWGGKVYLRERSQYNPNWQDVQCWALHASMARDFLSTIEPYMVIKKANAAAAVEGWDNRGRLTRWSSEEERQVVADNRRYHTEIIQALNKVGKNDN